MPSQPSTTELGIATLNDGVRIVGVTVRLGSRDVLRDIDLTLGTDMVALVGPNGAGKSTLLRLLATLVAPTRGDIFVAGQSLRTRRGAAEARAGLGYLPQDPVFPGHFTVQEAVEYAAWLKKVPRGRRRTATMAVIDELDLGGVRSRHMRELSGGTRRRAYIAQALVHQPHLLILDEPTTGLDATHRVDLRRVLRQVAARRVLVMSTHITEDLEMLANRVVVLHEGRIRFDGTPQELAALGQDGQAGADPDARAVERGLRHLEGLE
ncbi:MAG: ABC transporter ATP-binding protein [Actinomycetota bacterium]